MAANKKNDKTNPAPIVGAAVKDVPDVNPTVDTKPVSDAQPDGDTNVTIETNAVKSVDSIKETPETKPTESPDASEEIKSVLSDINKSIGLPSDNADSSAETVQVKKSKLHLTDKVPCRSLFHGKLVYTSPLNGSRWLWNEYGAIQYVPLSELETMNNHKPVFLNKPLLVILEPSVVEDFNFGEVYRKVASFNKFGEDLRTKDVEYIRKVVRGLVEVGMRDSAIGEVRKQRKDNALVDVNIINMLNTELKTDIG